MYRRNNLPIQPFNLLQEILNFVDNQQVLVRVDFNASRDSNLHVTDFQKILVTKDTIVDLLDAGAIPVLMSHLGDPKGKDANYSMKPFAEILEGIIGRPVVFIDDCIGQKRDEAIQSLKPGEIALLENLRFYPGEKKNDDSFAEQLARGFSFYVNEAFASSHRKHASIDKVAAIIGSKGMCCAGYNFQDEYFNLSRLTDNPETPFVAITGGKKVEDKMPLLRSLIKRNVNTILIGGAMANTFLLAMGYEIGKSFVEPERVDEAREILELAKACNKKIVLPVDVAVLDENGVKNIRRIGPNSVRKTDRICDVGPMTLFEFKKALRGTKTVFWNGNLGVTEDKVNKFNKGTNGIAGHLARFSNAIIVTGGGDTSAAMPEVAKERIQKNGGYPSTCGGSIMDFIAKDGDSPGLMALRAAGASVRY